MASLSRRNSEKGYYAWMNRALLIISLDERALVRLLFGHVPLPSSFAHVDGVQELSRLLPLPLFVTPLDHV